MNKNRDSTPGGTIRRRAQAGLYIVFVLAYLGFLLYYLTIRPGGAAGTQNAIWIITGFVSGGMMMMAIYALTLHLFLRGEKALLYFALYCIGSSARFLMMDGSLTLMELAKVPDYNVLACIRYLAIGLQVVGYISFIFEIFAEPKHKRRLPYLNAAIFLISVLSAALAASGANAAALADLFMLLITAISVGYGIILVIRSARLRGNKLYMLYFVTLIMYAVSPFLTVFLRDMLPHTAIIASIVFVVAHIVLLADRYARAIRDVEEQNETLERAVAERTRDLTRKNETLNKLNRAKTDFLQDMSHEMKNPLTVIATGIDRADVEISIKDGNIADAKAALANARDEIQRLGRMVSGMVSMASISEVGKNRERVDFAAFLRNGAEAFRPVLKQKNNDLKIEIADGMPNVFIEKDRFTQVISNLLSNASNHTQGGQVTLAADYNDIYITVLVSDTGEGIEPELLPRVFERGVSGRGGTGYGLYICKTVVEAHGGTIKIESVAGEGTTAIFTVPVYGGQEAGRTL